MIRSLLVPLCILWACMGHAQRHGNEWIQYGNRYWSFPTVQEGLHRIDSATLAQAGFPIASVDARELRLFGREQEIPLYVEGEADGVLNGDDFIEFFAPLNDSWKDSTVWDDPRYISDPRYPLFNDTLRYYLTWGGAGAPLRIQNYTGPVAPTEPERAWGLTTSFFSSGMAYRAGARSRNNASLASYGAGEGMYRAMVTSQSMPGTELVLNLPMPNAYRGADAPPVRVHSIMSAGNSAAFGICPDHRLQLLAGTDQAVVVDTAYAGYQVHHFFFEAPVDRTASAGLAVRYRVPHDLELCGGILAADYPDIAMVGLQRLTYARDMVFGAQRVNHMLHPELPGEEYINLALRQTAGGAPVIYVKGEQPLRVIPDLRTGRFRCALPIMPGGTEAIHMGLAQVVAVGSLQAVNGTGYFRDWEGLDASNALVVITHRSLLEAAEAYAQVRAADPSLASPPIVVDVNELYDQFGGGIARHPQAIRAFLAYLVARSAVAPAGAFLIGKSTYAQRPAGGDAYRPYRTDPIAAAACMVPTFGSPPSDAIFGIGLRNDPHEYTVPVGRLSALTPAHVEAYTGKVASFMAQPPAAWMKNILHFRGGSTAAEMVRFSSYLDSYAAIARDTSFMGLVQTFRKQGDQPITGAPADSVRTAIENGVSIMTFFGHAVAESFDLTISDPEFYDWAGKHPLMIGNSCYTGNIHLYNGNSASEIFVRPPGKGAIAFMASVDLGFDTYLANFTREFYRSFSSANYGGSIGKHLQYATDHQLSTGFQNIDVVNNAQTFTLHGDPTLVLNSPELPDLDITDADVRMLPEVVTLAMDSFDLQVIVRNIGKGTRESFAVSVERSVDGSLIEPRTVERMLSLQAYQDTLVFRLPVQDEGLGAGLNRLSVRVDLTPDRIRELPGREEVNNVVQRSFQILSNDLLPVFPYDLSVVPERDPTLRASTADPFLEPRTYLFQIDTTSRFDSPVLEEVRMVRPGGVVEWHPSLPGRLNQSRDSTVFYWRCTADSVGSGLYNWHLRSFQFIPGKRGWGQAHGDQLQRNTFDLLHHDPVTRSTSYFSGTKYITVSTRGSSPGEVKWSIDLEMQEYNGCTNSPSMHLAVVEPLHFTAWTTRFQGQGRSFGNFNVDGACRQRLERQFVFRQDVPNEMDSLGRMLDLIPDGHVVVVFSRTYAMRTPLQASMAWPALQSNGAVGLTGGEVPDSVAYVFFFRKGDPASVREFWGQTSTDLVHTVIPVEVNARSGALSAPRTGEMRRWDALSWRFGPGTPGDSVSVRLAGQVGPGAPVIPLAAWNALSGAIEPLEQQVPGLVPPHVQVSATFNNPSDPLPRPAQLRRWHLLGLPVPECAIDPPMGLHTYMDGVYQGEQASAMVAVRNIGDLPMDSLLMAAWVVDGNNRRHLVHYKLNKPLAVGEVLRDTVRFSTLPFAGATSLVIEANPVDTTTGRYHQPEEYHGNNIATIQFSTVADRINPVLDVTFDGLHILNGDIVSAKAEVEIRLQDENPVLLMDQMADTACFRIFLTRPDGQQEILPFARGGREIMQFIPATSTGNVARIRYQGDFPQDGTYRLLVTAKDKSNNQSGTRDMNIAFEVVNRATITDVLNYPNPFTTSTRFVFTLTGSRTPTAMRIQIMTITGRVVREISLAELGPLRIGKNITDYAWDGTDDHGDRLARGVYLYRVMARLDGEDMEVRESGASGWNTKGMGKMYLLR